MKTQNPLIGRSTKSIGENTFYVMNGQNIVRTKPFQVANPNTAGQQQQRTRFKALTAAANSLPEAELEALFETKQPGRNRRTSLQAQLAPAYGVQANPDPTAAEKYLPTFDVTKLGDIGSGKVGYIGELIEIPIVDGSIEVSTAKQEAMLANMVNYETTDIMTLVMVSEDGCQLMVFDTDVPISDIIDEPIAIDIEGAEGARMAAHGNKVYAYAYPRTLKQTGLGTFSVAERKARKGHNPLHGR